MTAQDATGTITGLVFWDKNMNGLYDTVPDGQIASDSGYEGVEVRAFDSTGAEIDDTTSGADGTYTLDVATAATADVRIEFTTPTGYQPTVVNPAGGTNASGTSIQFVSAGATDVNFGIQVPGDYCNNNPKVASNCIREGSVNFSNNSSSSALELANWFSPTPGKYSDPSRLAYPYSEEAPTTVSKFKDVGATWGIAYQRTAGLIWNSAFIRAHAGLGPKGLGGLYVYDTAGNPVASFDLVTEIGRAHV